jgi:transcriptional antiterminator RfaH
MPSNRRAPGFVTFKEGLSAELATGPFAGFIGKITQVEEDQRVWLLLDFVGQQTRVQVSSDQLNIVNAAS